MRIKRQTEIVPENEIQSNNCKYLPHWNIKAKKFRVVINGSDQSTGTSLNEALLHSPDITSKLDGVALMHVTLRYLRTCQHQHFCKALRHLIIKEEILLRQLFLTKEAILKVPVMFLLKNGRILIPKKLRLMVPG